MSLNCKQIGCYISAEYCYIYAVYNYQM